MSIELHCRISIILLAFCFAILCACGESPANVNEAEPGSEYITQFSDLTSVGSDLIWVVTSRGDLIRVSKDGQHSKANIESGEVSVVTFIDPIHGWVLDRKSRIWSTSDVGHSWNLLFTPPPSEEFYQPQQLIFVNETHGWLVGLFAIWRTADGGKTWAKKFSVVQASEKRVGRLYRGTVLNNDSLRVSTSGGVVLQTSDAGESWKSIIPTSKHTDFHDIFFTTEQRGYVIGRPNGGIYITSDGGNNWRSELDTTGLYFNSVTFVGVSDGWASGWSSKVESEGRKGVVFQTIDGGAHWKPIGSIPNESVFMIVRFSDKEHGWLAGRDSLYRTDDGGNSWRVVLKLPPMDNQ